MATCLNIHITEHMPRRDRHGILYDADGTSLQHWTDPQCSQAGHWPHTHEGPVAPAVEQAHRPLMQGDQVLLLRDPEPLVDWRSMPFHSPYSRLRPLVVTHRGASGIPGSFRVLRGSKPCHQEQVLQQHAYGESWVLLQRTPRQQPLRPLTRFRHLKRARSDTTGAKTRSSRALGRTRSDPGRRRVQAPPVPRPPAEAPPPQEHPPD